MKALAGAVVILVILFTVLLYIDARQQRILNHSAKIEWRPSCEPGQFLTGEGKCQTVPDPDIDISVPSVSLPDHLPKCAPGEVYNGNYHCQAPIIIKPTPAFASDSILIGEPTGGTYGTGVINVLPSEKVYRNGHELMSEEEWRARFPCEAPE